MTPELLAHLEATIDGELFSLAEECSSLDEMWARITCPLELTNLALDLGADREQLRRALLGYRRLLAWPRRDDDPAWAALAEFIEHIRAGRLYEACYSLSGIITLDMQRDLAHAIRIGVTLPALPVGEGVAA